MIKTNDFDEILSKYHFSWLAFSKKCNVNVDKAKRNLSAEKELRTRFSSNKHLDNVIILRNVIFFLYEPGSAK